MLNLAAATDRSWAERAVRQMDAVLLDHAHCEKKAASTALHLIFRYPHHDVLLEPLAELAREELEHFQLVLRVLRERGIPFGRQRPSPYAARLRKAVREREPERLLDVLLCCALIEARSCERMKLLAEAVPDPGLAAFYRDLLACEARHHATYVELARALYDPSVVRERLAELAVLEAEVVVQPPEMARLHASF